MKVSAIFLAQRYSEALYNSSYSQLQETLLFLKAMSVFLDTRAPFSTEALRNIMISKGKQQFVEMISKISTPWVAKLFDILVRNNRIKLLPQICTSFVTIYNKKHNIIQAGVTSTIALSCKEISSIEALLSSHFNKRVIIQNHLDKSILHGMIIRIADNVIDLSLAKKMLLLKKASQDAIA